MTDERRAQLSALYETIRRAYAEAEGARAQQGDFLHPVFGEGDPCARLLLLGEAPGAEEAMAGRPFVGKAGRQLDELLKEAGILRRQIYITNAVKFRPVVRSAHGVRNRTPSKTEVRDALPALGREIDLVRPAVIATLGNSPLNAVLALAGESHATIGACHGQARPLTILARRYTLFPLYHPASGIYNRSLIEVMYADARALGEHLVKEA